MRANAELYGCDVLLVNSGATLDVIPIREARRKKGAEIVCTAFTGETKEKIYGRLWAIFANKEGGVKIPSQLGKYQSIIEANYDR